MFKNLFINRSIRWKFVVYTILPIIIIFSIFLVLAIRNLEELSTANIEAEKLRTVEFMGNRLERQFRQLADIAIMNKHYLEISPEITQPMIFELVKGTLASHPLIYGAAIAFEPYRFPGRKLFSPYAYHVGTEIRTIDIGDPAPGIGYDYTSGEWEWWTAPRAAGESLWTAPYFDEGAGNIVMSTYSVPFFRDGKFYGIATVDVALESAFKLLRIIQEGNNVIVSRDGKFIHHPDPSHILEMTLYDLVDEFSPEHLDQLMAAAGSGKVGLIKLPKADSSDLIWIFYAPIPSTDWLYIYFLPEDTALAFTRYQWQLFASLFVLTVVLVLGILWYMSGLLTSPIRELHAAAMKVSEGNFNTWVKYKSSDELGKLTAIFNKMTATLSRREEDLEKKVEARTNELKSSQVEVIRQKENLANQLALQQALIDTIPNPIFYKDADTRFLGFNKAYEQTFGVNGKEQIGLRVLDLLYLPEADRKLYQQEDEDTIMHQKTIKREMRMPFADGKVHDTLYWVSGFRKSDGSPGGLVGTFIDITEEKEIARQLELAKNAAEAATEAKANFLASMSHEIRTPMNGIIGMVELLRQSNLGSEYQAMLHTISDSGQALLTIINDILDFSKIEAGRLELESIPVSLIEVVEGSAETLASAALAKRLKLITYIDPAIPAYLAADPVRLRQILINLIGNAIKFTDKGEIIIRADLLESKADHHINVRFSVQDKGIGISETAKGQLFSAFTQAESSTTRKYGGTGLGLSICQRLVKMMGGEIGVNSRLGEGSEFFAVIPLGINDRKPAHDYSRELAGLSVAVVSSSDTELLACTKYLEYWDVEVSAYADAGQCISDAVQSPNGKPIDILVLGSVWNFEQQKQIFESCKQGPVFATTKFVFLIPGRRREKARLYGDNLVTIDVGPLKRTSFISAVAIAAGRKSPEVYYEDKLECMKADYTPTVEEAVAQGTLILVVEDNPVNQDVIKRQLAMLGYACEVVNNGKEALEARSSRTYAVVLTDCHMPEMDGFELTGRIRMEEKTTGNHVPIIAITANALQGEAERCLAAGMDDYMSKPIAMKELRNKLKQWLPKTDQSSPANPEPVNPSDSISDNSCVIDTQVLKDIFDDDATVQEILAGFINPSVEIVTELKAGYARQSAEAVKQAAHKLKSSARSVGANALADLCLELETAGRDNDLARIGVHIPALDKIMADTTSYIEKLLHK